MVNTYKSGSTGDINDGPAVTINNTAVTSENVGTAATGVTAVEYGSGYIHTTVLTLATTLPAIVGGTNLGLGKLIYTLPGGAIIVKAAYMSAAITQTEGNITLDTPKVGLGSVIAVGAVTDLTGTATFDDIITEQTAGDCDGTASVKTIADQILVVETGDDHTIHFNTADGWAASGDVAATLTGTVILEWIFVV